MELGPLERVVAGKFSLCSFSDLLLLLGTVLGVRVLAQGWSELSKS
jgi:hypothetical protein